MENGRGVFSKQKISHKCFNTELWFYNSNAPRVAPP
jgi:hypothetical protein